MGDLSQFKTLKLDEQPTVPPIDTSKFKTLKLDSDHSSPSQTPSSPDGANNALERGISGFGSTAGNAVAGTLHLLGDAAGGGPLHSDLVMNEILPAYLAGKKLVQQGAGELHDAFTNPGNEDFTSRALQAGAGLTHIVGGFTPFGPGANATGEQIANGDVARGVGSALFQVGSTAAGLYGAGEAPEAIDGAEAQGANTATTQEHLNAHAGILARGNAVGKGFVPQQVAADITPAVRQAAANNPEITNTALGKPIVDAQGNSTTPTDVQRFAAYQGLLDEATKPSTILHNKALASVSDHAFDPTAMQAAARSAFPEGLRATFPDDAAAVDNVADQMGTINTLGKANAMRQYLNKFLGPEYRKNLVAAGRSDAEVQANVNAANALRDDYYKQLGDASGYDLQNAKRIEAGILAAKEGLQNATPGITADQALAEQPMTIGNMVGAAAQGMAKSAAGPTGFVKVVAQKLLGQKPLTQINHNIETMLTRLPEPQPMPQGPYMGPIDQSDYGSLFKNNPAPGFNNRPQLNADNPINADANAPDPVESGNGMPTNSTAMANRDRIQTSSNSAIPANITPAPRVFPQLPAATETAPGHFEGPTIGFDDGGNMVERVHPYNMQVPTGYTTDVAGNTRIDFQAPDSLLNMLRMKAGKTPFDPFIRPRDPQQMYVNNPNQPALNAPPNYPDIKVTGSIVNGPPRPTDPTAILNEWQQDKLNGNQ
jgi:hypothetical protein